MTAISRERAETQARWVCATLLPVGVVTQIVVPVGPAGVALAGSDLVVAMGCLLAAASGFRLRPLVWFVLPLLALTCAFMLGLSRFGFQSWAAVRVVGVIAVAAHVYVAAWIAEDRDARDFALKVLLVTLAMSVFVDVAIVYGNRQFAFLEACVGWVGAARGLTQNASAFGFALLMGFMVLIAEQRRALSAWPTWAVSGVGALMLFGTLMSASRSAWLSLVIAVPAALYVVRPPGKRLACGTVCGLLLVALALLSFCQPKNTWIFVHGAGFLPADTPPQVFKTFDPAASNIERLYTYFEAAKLFVAYPFFGAGLGAFIRNEIMLGHDPLIIHSTTLWLLAEAGILGLACFLVFAGLVMRQIARIFASGERGDAQAAALILLAFGLMSTMQELFYQRSLWMLLGFYVFAALGSRQDAPPPARLRWPSLPALAAIIPNGRLQAGLKALSR